MRSTRCPRCHRIAPRVVLTDGATRVPACAHCAAQPTPELEAPVRETVPTDSEGPE